MGDGGGASTAIAVVIASTREYNALILVGAVLEALIYADAGLCVIRLRRRQGEAARSFRVPFGWTIPLLTVVIFTALGFAAALVSTPLPLVIAVVIFAVSFAYVRLEVPRLKVAAEAKRKAAGTRRPRRPSPQSDGGAPAEASGPAQE